MIKDESHYYCLAIGVGRSLLLLLTKSEGLTISSFNNNPSLERCNISV